MKIVGIDPSLTAPGLAAIVDGRAVGTHTFTPSKMKGKVTEEMRQRRLDEIVAVVRDWATGADVAVIEGLAFDGHDTMRQLAGIQWILRREIWRWGLKLVVVPPSSLKKFADVGGSANKDLMLDAARDVFEIEIGDHNAADALWLAEVGAAWAGCPVREVSTVHLGHLQGVTWPITDLAA